MRANKVDVLLVGGGVMSATLGMLLAELDPGLEILMLERQDRVAAESSDAWNNAGTGHAGYCELNYTPEAGGKLEIGRALAINAAFETSLQLWSALVERQALPQPGAFINRVPHLSLVWGAGDVDFLRRRHAALSAHPLFADMAYSEDADVLREWMPLAMEGRGSTGPIAATRVDYGTDVDFGALTRGLVDTLVMRQNFELRLRHVVENLAQQRDGRWHVRVRDAQGAVTTIASGFVFLGAGGGALPLLQQSGIPEGRGYGGFPVSGQWLVCRRAELVGRHHAKIYGKAALGAPPMSVPHLDTRLIAGQASLLFGPFAGFTTRFQKSGSYLDLFGSVTAGNLRAMLAVGVQNLDLTRYLMGEALQSHAARMATLRGFCPQARTEDWTLAHAGKRVQIIKTGPSGAKLEFGTEIVAAADGSLAALLGASPGASISTAAMLQVIERCFARRVAEPGWQEKLRALIPAYGQSLVDDAALLERVRGRTLATLGLAPA